MTLAQALSAATARGLERLDAQWLLLHALGRLTQDRAWLLTHDTDTLTPEKQTQFDTAVQRRLSGEPLAYITGTREFFGLPLQVDARVLDPRPDTETLVEWALDVLSGHPELVAGAPKILDLGTGSGDRSDRIRTYNFPQGRLTDHRINLTLYKLGAVMDGELDDVVAALKAARAAEQLAQMEAGSA